MRTVWTSEFGVDHPTGLTYDSSRGQFLVAGDAAVGTKVLRLGPDEDPRGSFLLPELTHPSTLAFDAARRQLTAVEDGEQIVASASALDDPRPATQRDAVDGVALEDPSSATFDPRSGTWLVLDEGTDEVALISGDDGERTAERLDLAPSGTDRLIAFNTSDDLLYVVDPDRGRVDGIDLEGNVETSFDLSSTALVDPVAMTFAPSSDATDDADNLNLFVADSGDATTNGGVTELSLTASATALAATIDTATLVQTIHTSQWTPGSPDPSGIVWLPSADELAVVDSEVDETTGAGWHNVNFWRSTRTGSVRGTGALWGPTSAGSYSKEPTGLGYDAAGDTLFISDDSARRVFVVKRGNDGVFATTDDIVTSINTSAIGSSDTEDPEFVSGHLFFLDGVGMEIYRVNPVDGVFGNGNDTVTHFDISHLGPRDFEGVASDPGRGTLYVGARTTKDIFEITHDGTLVRTIDADGISGLRFISGLATAPASNGTGTNLWIVDRAVDNGADPNENDGKIFEITAPNIGSPPPSDNQPPVVNAVRIDQTAPGTNDTLTVTVEASDADGDPFTYSYQWTRNGQNISGATSATLNLSVAGNGDKGDAIAVRVTASDGTASSAPVTSPTVTVVDSPPTFNQDLGDRTSQEGATVSLSAGATDPDGDPLTFEATGLPSGLTINASTGQITGTVATGASADSPYAVTITVRDGTAVDATDTFTWTITADTAPGAPTGLGAAVTSTGINLDWNDSPEPDLAGYVVYRSTAEAGPFQRLTASPIGGSAYQDLTAPRGTSHYRVAAVDVGGRESTPATTSATRRILFRSAASASARNVISFSLSRPGGVASGDVMLAAVSLSETVTVTAPTGWAMVRVETNGSTMRQAIYRKVAAGGEPSSYLWGLSARTSSVAGAILAYEGVDTLSSVDASNGASGSTSGAITAPSVSTTVQDTMLVGFFGIESNSSIIAPTGMIKQAETLQNAGKDKLALAAADAVLPAVGASGPRSATVDKNGSAIGQLVALRPMSP